MSAEDRTERLPVTDAGTTLPDEPTAVVTPPAEAADRSTDVVEPATAETAPAAPTRPHLRVGTVVWGLIVAVIGVGVVALASGAEIDVELALIVLLGLAGVGLLGGSIAMAARRPRG